MGKICMGCMEEYPNELNLCPYCGYEEGTKAESALHMSPGSVLNGRYLIGRVLGYGGFGVTYIAWDQMLQQKVAIKEYLPSEFATRMAGQSQVTVFGGKKEEQYSDGKEKFLDEAKRLVKFQDEPGIVRIYDSFDENNTAYIVMELLEGETLTSYLEREGKVPIGEAISMLTPVIKSLEAVHKTGIIHRDIAPDNIFLTNHGTVKLIDFGAARYATTSNSRSLTVIIKAGYSPEEQYRSRGDQGPHTDVYALGAVLYKMVTGVTPPDAMERRAFFEGKNKDVLVPPSKYCDIKKCQENAILNAMNVRIEDRTPSAEAFLSELNSTTSVERIAGKIKKLDTMSWPLWAKIAIPICGALAVALCVLLFTGRIGYVSNLVTDIGVAKGMTRVPNVINSSVAEAQDTLEAKNLKSVIDGKVVSEKVPADMVLKQSADGGTVVDDNTVIKLTVSAGAEVGQLENGIMPDVTYTKEEDTVSLFETAGYKVTVEYEYSSDVEKGLVTWQSVASGTKVDKNTPISLKVSKGPDPNGDSGKLKLNHDYLTMYVGDSVSLSAEGGDSYQWGSSNAAVATVSGKGAVKAQKAGTAVITVKSGSSSVSCSVTVKDYVLALNQSSISLLDGDSYTLTAYGIPAGTSISWSSSNNSVASVSGGTVTGKSAGSATITATAKGKRASCTVNVTLKKVPVSNIGLGYNSMALIPGRSFGFSPSVSPENATNKQITWKSSNNDVVSVTDTGIVYAHNQGSAIVTATADGVSRSCTITVVSGEWSTTPLNQVGSLSVQTKNQYRYRQKQTTTSTASSLSGWTQYNKQTSYSDYGAWSSWQRDPVSGSETRKVETSQQNGGYRTYYNLYCYKYWNTNYNKWYYTYSSNMGGEKLTTTAPANECTPYKSYEGHQAYSYNGHNLWFIESSYDEAIDQHTEYRYADRTVTTTYYYYQWSNWTDWMDGSASSTQDTDVETRQLYRYA